MPKKSDIQKIVDVLNDAFKRDPDAITKLVTTRVSCNVKLADHPTIIVREDTGVGSNTFSVSPIGLINGIIAPLLKKRIAISVLGEEPPPDSKNRKPKILGFTVYKK